MTSPYDAEEARCAREAAEREGDYGHCPPGHHHMRAVWFGGGVCADCGDTVNAEEL